MGELRMIVNHDKIDYNGPLNVQKLLLLIENFLWERGYDKQQEKDFEQNTDKGKFIEWQYKPWKKITDYIRYMVKVRVLGYDLVKVDTVVDGKKTKVESGRVIIVIDGFMEYDYDNRWDLNPVMELIRGIYDHFIYHVYTERWEHRLTNDINTMHNAIEQYLNMHRRYTVISRKAP